MEVHIEPMYGCEFARVTCVKLERAFLDIVPSRFTVTVSCSTFAICYAFLKRFEPHVSLVLLLTIPFVASLSTRNLASTYEVQLNVDRRWRISRRRTLHHGALDRRRSHFQ